MNKATTIKGGSHEYLNTIIFEGQTETYLKQSSN